jgi:hypothetical protein
VTSTYCTFTYPSSTVPYQLATTDFLQSTSDTPQPSYEDPLAQLVREVEQQPFTTNQSLQGSLNRRQQPLQQDQIRDQSLVFTSVPPAEASRLSDDRSRTSKYCRFMYNPETKILIVKVNPDPAHELAKSLFGFFSSLSTCVR